MLTPRYSAQGRSFHVLVVDDELAVLELCRERLEGDGHHVTILQNVKNLDTLLLVLRPDVVLMDVMMPDLTGSHLARVLDKHGAESLPAVILHSTIPMRALRLAVATEKALGVIQKTQDDIEFFFAFNALIDRLPATSLRERRASVPAVSGTHRIADDETTEVDALTQHWFSRTSPGRA